MKKLEACREHNILLNLPEPIYSIENEKENVALLCPVTSTFQSKKI